MSVFSSKVAGAAAAVSPISSSMSPAAARSNEDYIAGARVEEEDDDDHQQKPSGGDKAKKPTASCSGTVLYRLYVTFIVLTGPRILLYCGLNATMGLFNRWALGVHGFHFPLILTGANMVAMVLTIGPVVACWPSMRAQVSTHLRKHIWPVCAVSILNGVQLALNNASLVRIELSMNQIIRSASPVVIAILGRFILHTPKSTRLQRISLLLLTLGVALTVRTPTGFNSAAVHVGILQCILGTILLSLQMVISQRLLGPGTRIHPLLLTLYTAAVACVTLLPVAIWAEGWDFATYFQERHWETVMVLGVGCSCSVVYSIIVFTMIKVVSATGTAIVGNVQLVLLLGLAEMLLDEMKGWSTRQFLGVLSTIVGAGVWTYCKVKKPSKPSRDYQSVPQVDLETGDGTATRSSSTSIVQEQTTAQPRVQNPPPKKD